MKTPMQIEILAKNTIEITTDEYADLIASRTRLDVVCDLLSAQTYPDKEILLVVARGVSVVIATPKEEPTEPEEDSKKETTEPVDDSDLPPFLR